MSATGSKVQKFHNLSEVVDRLHELIAREHETTKHSWVLISVTFPLESLSDIHYTPSAPENYAKVMSLRHSLMAGIEPLLNEHFDFDEYDSFARTVRIHRGVATLMVDIVYRT